jgi:pyruvate formate lyase activating enzyme
MTSGIVFDIKEFAVHDGPGLRTTVFLKGCPLSCMWCHNPEGQFPQPQLIRSPAGERISGKVYQPGELAFLLNQQAAVLRQNEGGITFSGGEPLLQAKFVSKVIDQLDGLHVVLDTSAYGREADFRLLVARSDLIFFDLKLIDRTAHRHFTGCDNDLILNNLRNLSMMGKPFVVRVPMVPGVTDTKENLSAIAHTIHGMPGLLKVDLLPYNRAAGAKYENVGMQFDPEYDESRQLNLDTAIFERIGIKADIV